MNQAKAKNLIALCKKNLMENENNSRKFKGARVSTSDVETIILYCETIIRCGTYEGQLMTPRGSVAEVLKKSGLMD